MEALEADRIKDGVDATHVLHGLDPVLVGIDKGDAALLPDSGVVPL